MLVMTQTSAGGYFVELAMRATGRPVPTVLPVLSLVIGLIGIHAALLHLGRPLYAYRALIGIRHSWLSREIAAFGLFANLALAHAAALWFRPELATLTSAGLVAAAGVGAIFCSVMVYHVVRRPFWRGGISGTKFFGTALVTGLAAASRGVGRVAATWPWRSRRAWRVKLAVDAVDADAPPRPPTHPVAAHGPAPLRAAPAGLGA